MSDRPVCGNPEEIDCPWISLWILHVGGFVFAVSSSFRPAVRSAQGPEAFALTTWQQRLGFGRPGNERLGATESHVAWSPPEAATLKVWGRKDERERKRGRKEEWRGNRERTRPGKAGSWAFNVDCLDQQSHFCSQGTKILRTRLQQPEPAAAEGQAGGHLQLSVTGPDQANFKKERQPFVPFQHSLSRVPISVPRSLARSLT